MNQYHSFDPAQGHGLPHDPVKAIIAPRPIGWISSLDAQGRANLAPYSFFNMFASNPPILGFSSDGWKHSVANIEASGEFVFNLATAHLAQAMNLSSGDFPHGTDEFAKAGLEKMPGEKVSAPRVAGAAAAMECKLIEIKPLQDMDGSPVGNFLVLGQVVAVHIEKSYLTDGLFDIAKAQTIARCGYRGDYVIADHMFEMIRPKV